METERIMIDNIPAILWGKDKRSGFIAVHGNMSNKEDEVIKILAEQAYRVGCQVLSFDLPEHGERKDDKSILCNPQNCITDLKKVLAYAKMKFDTIYLWACSMGAYFSMLAYKDELFEQIILLSPVVDMKSIIDNMMIGAGVTEEELKEKQEIKTNFGPTLYWDYYEFVKNNPVEPWDLGAFVLYGSNDNMQDEKTIREFCDNNDWYLEVLDGGDHYFHTEEQLEFYKDWLFEIFS